MSRRFDRAARHLAVAALSLTFSIAFAFAPRAARADCSPTGGVHINELRYFDVATPEEGRLNALVELYNKDASPVTLDGWEVRDHAGAVKHTFAPLSLPAGAFLELRFETGSDDTDFSDGVGTIFTNGDSVGVSDPRLCLEQTIP